MFPHNFLPKLPIPSSPLTTQLILIHNLLFLTRTHLRLRTSPNFRPNLPRHHVMPYEHAELNYSTFDPTDAFPLHLMSGIPPQSQQQSTLCSPKPNFFASRPSVTGSSLGMLVAMTVAAIHCVNLTHAPASRSRQRMSRVTMCGFTPPLNSQKHVSLTCSTAGTAANAPPPHASSSLSLSHTSSTVSRVMHVSYTNTRFTHASCKIQRANAQSAPQHLCAHTSSVTH